MRLVEIKSLSEEPGRYEAERKVRGQGPKPKTPGGVVDAAIEDVFGRQRRNWTLQPAAIERVIRIGSKGCAVNRECLSIKKAGTSKANRTIKVFVSMKKGQL